MVRLKSSLVHSSAWLGRAEFSQSGVTVVSALKNMEDGAMMLMLCLLSLSFVLFFLQDIIETLFFVCDTKNEINLLWVGTAMSDVKDWLDFFFLFSILKRLSKHLRLFTKQSQLGRKRETKEIKQTKQNKNKEVGTVPKRFDILWKFTGWRDADFYTACTTLCGDI